MGLIVNIAARRLAKADINPERCITMIFYATLHHHCALPDRAHKIQVNTTSSRNISDFIMRAFRLPAFLLFPETQRDTRFERSAERERESRGGDLRTRFHPRTRATDYASWDETSSHRGETIETLRKQRYAVEKESSKVDLFEELESFRKL